MQINLLKLNHIDNTYQNTMDFSSTASRDDYFASKVGHTFEVNINDDAIIDNITLTINHKTINHYNYLYFTDSTNKTLYYFIINHEFKTLTTTLLHIQLDVFTTYQFDFKLLPSYVERCHVPRWNNDVPTKETIDEGISLNEYELSTIQTITTYNDGLIIASTQPLGVCPGFHVNTPSGGGGSTGGPTNGYITKSGFRFLKGYEAYTNEGLYLGGEHFKTVGYGSIEGTQYYEEHKPFPVSEQKSATIAANRIINDFGKTLSDRLKQDNIISKINYNQFDAMVSTCYNCGASAFLNDETSPYQLIKNNVSDPNIRTTWEKFYIKGYVDGVLVELPGLIARRKAEADIYLSKIYEFRDILKIVNNGNGIGVYDGIVTDNRGDGYIPDFLPNNTPIIEIIKEV